VERRLAACVNEMGTPVRSVYRWKGKVETAEEFLLVIKSTKRRFVALLDAVRELHSYEVPEIIALPVVEGSRAYLNWIGESVGERERWSKVRTSKRDPSLRSA
jgi:periplasmic divalent cation tolerance protein